jgi:MOSC domain-containing protein YiiM
LAFSVSIYFHDDIPGILDEKRMQGQIVQVNVSAGGLPKRPVMRAFIGPLGLEGDQHAHPEHHGGPGKAVLVISAEAVDALIADGFPLFYGALGENLTVRGVEARWLRPAQKWRAGGAIIELTTLRIPSSLTVYDLPDRTLQSAIWDESLRSGNTSSPLWGIAGFYASVVQPGEVRPDDPFVLLEQAV